ncbi:MAG: GTPase HflX [Candidatus Latescibacterota bacterium]|nr:MAG: GTPase HflX [Candidatus Latescibacterota bacterium]
MREKAILVGLSLPFQDGELLEECLDELARLADTAGAEVLGRVVQRRERIDPAYYIGRGKAEEISAKAKELGLDLVIFEGDLSPAQVKNLEELIPAKIVDRSGLILDIFARRARTKEAKVQVELAQLKYLLPRLTRRWTHLSRQVGGIGTRGPGETQLEVDRRRVRQRIWKLSKELEKIERARAIRRKGREGTFRVALVGYTNAGKSTLLNALTHADVFVEDRLFATLDATTRRMWVDGQVALLTDTVGFIRRLPHHLVASFRSTLGEVQEADLLLHVADVSHPACEEQIASVREVLEDLGVGGKPAILVLNKVDLLEGRGFLERMLLQHPGAVPVSAKEGTGLDQLRRAISEHMKLGRTTVRG